MPKTNISRKSLFKQALRFSITQLNPVSQKQNPVFLCLWILSALLTLTGITSLFLAPEAAGVSLLSAAILWGIQLLSGFAWGLTFSYQAAQTVPFKNARKEVTAYRIPSPSQRDFASPISSSALRKGDFVIVSAGQQIPADGIVVDGAASVDESAITGESAPVIRENSPERNIVTGGTTVISDQLIIKVIHESGKSFLDQMLSMTNRNISRELGLSHTPQLILIFGAVGMFFACLLFLLSGRSAVSSQMMGIFLLFALPACVLPFLWAGYSRPLHHTEMNRLNHLNILSDHPNILEKAAKADIMILSKNGAITLGNRHACQFLPLEHISSRELADAAQLASLSDETPEGRSIVVLAKELFNIRARNITSMECSFIPYSEQTQMSGVNIGDCEIRKGVPSAIRDYIAPYGGTLTLQCTKLINDIIQEGGTPLLVAKNHRVLGVIHLRDIIKHDIYEKFSVFRNMGIKTVMLTQDPPMTAAAIAAEAGVDDFLAQATPATKLELVKKFQSEGHIVAMAGETSYDAPALAQADVGMVMNSGHKSAKEAAGLLDLDSSPIKLLEVLRTGRQLLYGQQCLTMLGISGAAVSVWYFVSYILHTLLPSSKLFRFFAEAGLPAVAVSLLLCSLIAMLFILPSIQKGFRIHDLPGRQLFRHQFLYYGMGGLLFYLLVTKLLTLILSMIL